jgi:hypothetical protein
MIRSSEHQQRKNMPNADVRYTARNSTVFFVRADASAAAALAAYELAQIPRFRFRFSRTLRLRSVSRVNFPSDPSQDKCAEIVLAPSR